MNGPGQGRRRVRLPYVEWLAHMLTARDWAIIKTVYDFRIVTGLQIEQLHFSELAMRSRSVMRWRVLKRQVDARILTTFDRRIGTCRRGSTQLRYVLDSAGQRLIRLQLNREIPDARVRRPRLPGERFVAHALAVTELYVALVEHSRLGRFVLDDFKSEGGAYWPNGLGGWIKPDALVKLHQGSVADYWWYEADLATESLPTIRAKLVVYLDFVHRGRLGPDGIVPRVLIGVPTSKRQLAIQSVIHSLPEPAVFMFSVVLMPDAATFLMSGRSQSIEAIQAGAISVS